MAKVTTYNPKKVTIALGNHIVTGVAEDSFITIESEGDGTTHVAGAFGEVVRSVDPSNVYTLQLGLLQSAETNKWLQTKYKQDKEDGTGTFSVNINDIMGNEKFVASTAWVQKVPAWTRGKQAQSITWTIIVGDGEFK